MFHYEVTKRETTKGVGEGCQHSSTNFDLLHVDDGGVFPVGAKG